MAKSDDRKNPPLHPEAGRAARGAQDRPARVPADLDPARPVGDHRLRHCRPGARRERDPARPRPGHAQDGRHPEGRHGGPEDGGPGDLRLGPDVEPDPAHRRVSGDHRPGQHHPADAGGELGGVRRPQDLDLQSAPGRALAQRRRVRRRARGLERQALARPRPRLIEQRPVDLPGDDRGQGRQEGDDPGRGRGGRQVHRPLQPVEAGAVGARGLLQLSDRDRASVVQAAALRQPDRHRAVHADRARGRRPLHSQADQQDEPTARISSTGAATSISTRSTTTTTMPTTS